MALTILTAPGNESSVNNEMIFIIQEPTKSIDPVTYTNYKYVLDVYVDGDLKARLRATPDPTYSFGRFDVSVILRDYVPAYGLKANYANPTEEYDIRLAYTCKLGEEYGDTTYPDLVTDSERTTYKTYKPRPFLTSDEISSKSGYIFSNRPFGTGINLTDHKVNKWNLVPYFGNATGVTISYNYDDGNGNIIGAGSTFSYTNALKVLQMNMGFEKLSSGLTTDEKNQVARIVFDVDDGLTQISYAINYACTKYTPVILAWLNPYGAYESQSFGLVSKKSNGVERKEYAQLPYQVNASGVVSYDSNGVLYGSKKGYAANVKTSLLLTSHLLTDAEYNWLADLFNSPDVYVFNTTLDRWVPVNIADTNYEYRTYKNSRLTPLQFTINFTDDYNSQFL
jgi:hypothetical protein